VVTLMHQTIGLTDC